MTRVLFCGTHPDQYNGYSKVVFELASYLSIQPDIDLHIFGFQNYYQNEEHRRERFLKNVTIYDAHKNEEPKSKGFGFLLIKDYVLKTKPDIVIIYNDLVVINGLLDELIKIENRKFKIVPYIDVVYKNEKNNLIQKINHYSDAGIMFTNYWKQVLHFQGFNKPSYVLEHGFNRMLYYPVEQSLARKYFKLSPNDFIIMNLNRNQPRKRWDICMMAFVKFISTRMDSNIKLLVATSLQGGWDLSDVIISETRKYNVTIDDFKKHLIVIKRPQQMSDFEINILYNVADVGLNTCDGEGFGLCNFEQAGVGVPQIIPNVGGFKDFFNKTNSMIISPVYSYYCDHSRDYVSGEAEICSVNDYVQALETYYTNLELRMEHGKNSRKNILSKYTWASKGEILYRIIKNETRHLNNKMNSSLEILHEDGDDEVEHVEDYQKPNEIVNEETVNGEDGEKGISTINDQQKQLSIDEMTPEQMKEALRKLLKTT